MLVHVRGPGGEREIRLHTDVGLREADNAFNPKACGMKLARGHTRTRKFCGNPALFTVICATGSRPIAARVAASNADSGHSRARRREPNAGTQSATLPPRRWDSRICAIWPARW